MSGVVQQYIDKHVCPHVNVFTSRLAALQRAENGEEEEEEREEEDAGSNPFKPIAVSNAVSVQMHTCVCTCIHCI